MNDLYRLDARFDQVLCVFDLAIFSKKGVNCVWRTLLGMDEEKQEWLG